MVLQTLTWWQILLVFLPVLVNFWGIWHAYTHQFATPFERILWMVLCVFLPLLGGIFYAMFGLRRVQKN